MTSVVISLRLQGKLSFSYNVKKKKKKHGQMCTIVLTLNCFRTHSSGRMSRISYSRLADSIFFSDVYFFSYMHFPC